MSKRWVVLIKNTDAFKASVDEYRNDRIFNINKHLLINQENDRGSFLFDIIDKCDLEADYILFYAFISYKLQMLQKYTKSKDPEHIDWAKKQTIEIAATQLHKDFDDYDCAPDIKKRFKVKNITIVSSIGMNSDAALDFKLRHPDCCLHDNTFHELIKNDVYLGYSRDVKE